MNEATTNLIKWRPRKEIENSCRKCEQHTSLEGLNEIIIHNQKLILEVLLDIRNK